MTYPAVLHLRDQVLGGGVDAWIFWWNNWWIKRALTTGGDPYFTKHLFFPHGVDLTYHSFSWLNSALWLLLEPILGNIAAYNMTVLWVFPLAGWGTERLVRELTHSRGAAFLAGLVFAFVPYRLGQYNHHNLMGTQWVPFYTLCLLQAIRGGRWRQLWLAVLYLVLTALVGWNLFIYLLIWTAWIGGCAWLGRMGPGRRIFGVVASVVLIGCLILSPLLIPMARRLGTEDALGTTMRQDNMQTDLLAYVVPSKFHPLWGQAVAPIYDHLGGPNEPRRVVYVGYVVMALLGYGLAHKDVRRRTGLWWGGALLWWLMALGPVLKLHGHIYANIPLPSYPLSRLYAFQLLKIPDRYNLMLSLPVAVLTGHAVADLAARLGRRWRIAGCVVLSALVLFEFLGVPVKMQSLEVRPFYEQLAQEEGEFGIVELPIDFHRTAKKYMLYQTIHGHPIAEGHVSRRPPEAMAFLDAHPLLRSLVLTHEMDFGLTDVSRQLHALRDAGFRYIIIHKQFMNVERVLRWRDYLTIAPRHEDDDLVVFTTDPQPGVDFTLTPVPGRALGIIRATQMPEGLCAGKTLTVTMRWGAARSPDRDSGVQFGLVDGRGRLQQQWTASLVAGWPTSEWQRGDVAIGVYPLALDNGLRPGSYALTVALEDPAGDTASPSLEIGSVQVGASDCESLPASTRRPAPRE
jgi:hypothetical protein